MTPEEMANIADQAAAKNPEPAIAALLAPHPLTLGQYAMLEKAGSPLLRGVYTNQLDSFTGVWLAETPAAEAYRDFDRRVELALEKYGAMPPAEFRDHLTAALNAIAALYEMMPKATDDEKKTATGAATDGSQRPSKPSPDGTAGK